VRPWTRGPGDRNTWYRPGPIPGGAGGPAGRRAQAPRYGKIHHPQRPRRACRLHRWRHWLL